MSQVVLYISFDLDHAKNEPREATVERARRVAEVPGLIWKVWLRDEPNGRGGGVYLFADRQSADGWLAEIERRGRSPWVSNSRRELLPIDAEFSAITHAKLA